VTTSIQPDIGTDFVGYRIEELIGRGGMGVVYRAYDLRLKRTIALKLVAPELALDEHFRERFARETELAMALEHPNVIPIYDAGDVDGRLYLAMRLVEGPDLRGILRREGALPAERAHAICAQVASALDAAHAKGLVHRDVKPSNVLVDADDHVYVADLGVGRRLEEVGEDRSVGTPAYLPPEEIEGGPVDGRADVYSLGCLFYECLTGEPPFRRDSPLALAWAHLEEEPMPSSARRDGLPQAIDAVLGKALAKSPDDRYATCAGFMDDAEHALGFARSRGSRRLLVLLAIAGLLAAAAAAYVFLHGHGTAAVPEVHANSLVRIDPATNKVSDVIDVGRQPIAIAIGAHSDSVWVYNEDSRSISEIDPHASHVRRTISVRDGPVNFALPYGPALAADASGAWLVGEDPKTLAGMVTNVRPGVPGSRGFRIGDHAYGVALGEGAVWIVAGKRTLVRLDPRTGKITARRRFAKSVSFASITAGAGFVWLVDSEHGFLYRVDPNRLRLAGRLFIGPGPGRPELAWGDVQVLDDGATNEGVSVRSAPLGIDGFLGCCPPQEGGSAIGFSSQWTVSWPSGTVVRWDGYTQLPVGTIHLTDPPEFGAPCMTAIAVGGGAVWVAVAPTSQTGCPA
jgi:serine/threonine-protein kinase